MSSSAREKPRARSLVRCRRRSALLVDDSIDNREMYAVYLEHSGWRALEASSGDEAIALATEQKPDVVVMDIELPGRDGYEITRVLKARPETREIPVFALSGHAARRHRECARAAGCDAFLAKPCTPRELVDAIEVFLAFRRMPPASRNAR